MDFTKLRIISHTVEKKFISQGEDIKAISQPNNKIKAIKDLWLDKCPWIVFLVSPAVLSPADLLAFAFNNILLRSKFYVIPLASIWMAGHMKGGEWGFLLFNYAVFFVRVHFSLFIFLQPNCFKPKGKLGFPDGSAGKEYGCNTGDTGDVGSIPGLERSPGGTNGNPLQYSCPESAMDRGAWQSTV